MTRHRLKARVRELIAPTRRPVAVVLWGGRDVDLQLGSAEDRDRAHRQLIYARVSVREGSRRAAVAAAVGQHTGISAAAVAHSFQAFNDLGIRAAAAQAELQRLGGTLAAHDAIRAARVRARTSAMPFDRAVALERERLMRGRRHGAVAELDRLLDPSQRPTC